MDVNSLIGNVGASVTGSVLSKLVCYPLDTIVVQYQTSTNRALSSIPLRAYYRGIGVTLLTVTPATAVYLTTKEAAHASLLPRLGEGALLDASSGIIAELAGSILFTPMEVIKARLQISRSTVDASLRHHLTSIYTKEGPRGFYRGYFMGIASYIPYNAIWWITYGRICREMEASNYSTTAQITTGAGAAAGLSAAFIHPLELVKTRYQVATSDTVGQVGERKSDQESMRQVARNVFRERGLRGFYAGFMPMLMKSAPSAIMTMLVFENLKARKTPDEPLELAM